MPAIYSSCAGGDFYIEILGITLNTKATDRNEEYALGLVAAGLVVSIVPSHSIGNLWYLNRPSKYFLQVGLFIITVRNIVGYAATE